MSSPFDQSTATVRFEWALSGARELARPGDLVVVVDVLSFTTSVDVACGRGAVVLPYRWADATAQAYAAAQGAVLAVGRRAWVSGSGSGSGSVSLSPVTLRDAPSLDRVVLPSPNGSTICTEVAGSGATVVAGCLRNASSVGRWVGARLVPAGTAPARALVTPAKGVAEPPYRGRPVTVVAAGERWPDGSLRPCVEDLWGAGAVLCAVVRSVPDAVVSREAGAAMAAYAAVAVDLTAALGDCASGRELSGAGFREDVALAAEADVSRCVPVLDESRAFRDVNR